MRVGSLAALLLLVGRPSEAADAPRLVVVLYPSDNDGRPGNRAVDQGIRSTFASGPVGSVEVHNEYLDVARFPDAGYQEHLAKFLRQKYAGQRVDLVIAGMSSALDFAVKYRETAFPDVPIIFCAVDDRELKARSLPPDVVGAPIHMDMAGTLDVALKNHPKTLRVFVVAGASKFDAYWEAEARKAFRPYEDRLEFTYLSGLPMPDLLEKVAHLPERSIIYYLHVFRDGAGKVLVPADVLEQLAARSNAPIYSHVDTYVGRGLVGGRVFTFEAAGSDAAKVGLRILAGEKPETISIPEPAENTLLFDSRQLRRWDIGTNRLPTGSVVRFEDPSFWDLYKWHILGVIALCVVEALLIVGLLVQRGYLRRAEDGLKKSQRELRQLTGRLMRAQEMERRRIARELHDDLSQSLALLSVDMELLGQRPPEAADGLRGRMQELSGRVKQLASTVHDLSRQLHPSKLEQLGLAAAVRGLCKELGGGHALPIEFTAGDSPGPLSEDADLCLYRIAQEALHNIIKHSGARRTTVELSGGKDAVELHIVDDGAGFDARLADGKGGLGLVSMRERLRLVGGTIAIDSRLGAGTRIDVRVPLGAAAPDEPALSAAPSGIA